MTTSMMTFKGNPWPTNDQREESFGSVPTGYQRKSEGYLGRTRGMIVGQVGVGNELLATGRGLMNWWRSKTAPMFDTAASYANRSPQYYVDRAAVDSNQSFDESRAVLARTMERMGINPNSGRFAGLQSKWGLARAAAEAGAKTRARNQAEDMAFLRLMNLVQMGNQGISQGAGLMSGAGGQYGAASQGYRGLAGAYDTLATDSARLEENRKREAVGLPPLVATLDPPDPRMGRGLPGSIDPNYVNEAGQLEIGVSGESQDADFDIWNP